MDGPGKPIAAIRGAWSMRPQQTGTLSTTKPAEIFYMQYTTCIEVTGRTCCRDDVIIHVVIVVVVRDGACSGYHLGKMSAPHSA